MNTERDRLLNALTRLSELRPDFRFGQLVLALTFMVRPPTDDAVYDVEDRELIDAANRMLLSSQQPMDKAA